MEVNIQLAYLGKTKFIVAIKSLAILANSKELVTSNILTERLGIESSFIRKVLAKLMQEKMVEGFGGRYGGYRLLTKPEETTLNDIYIALTKDAHIDEEPSKIDNMDQMILSIVLESQNEFEKILTRYTISDLAKVI